MFQFYVIIPSLILAVELIILKPLNLNLYTKNLKYNVVLLSYDKLNFLLISLFLYGPYLFSSEPFPCTIDRSYRSLPTMYMLPNRYKTYRNLLSL